MYRCLFGLCLNLSSPAEQELPKGLSLSLSLSLSPLCMLPPFLHPPSRLTLITISTMSSTFTYLLIPADTSLPVQKLTASKAGGLSDDELQKEAKQYFFERSDKKAMQGELLMCRYC